MFSYWARGKRTRYESWSSSQRKLQIHQTIYGEDDAFFKIEAKRLAKIDVAREKEYVLGRMVRRMGQDKYLETGEGIERFKKGIHGKNLRHAAIIGYIQNEDFDYWFNQINSWIADLITEKGNFWKKEDKLIKTNQGVKSSLVLNSKNFSAKPDSKPDYIHFRLTANNSDMPYFKNMAYLNITKSTVLKIEYSHFLVYGQPDLTHFWVDLK